MTKHDFKLHTIETAPEASRSALAEVNKKFGRVPNFFGVTAESPAATKYCPIFSKPPRSRPAEQQIVILTASVENKCDYCVAAHSRGAKMAGVPEDAINAIKAKTPLKDAKTEALRRLVSQIVDKRGWLSDADVQAFLNQGYSRSQLLDVMVGVSMKTLSNYINHLTGPPIE
jgi:AhpD family alkylhydroperoxidase